MADWTGTPGDDAKDFFEFGNSDDNGAGLGGGDLISGWQGNDRLSGGMGNDFLYGEAGNDALFGGPEDDLLAGADDADELHGGPGFDTLDGGGADDSLYGDADVDWLYGGAGNDGFFIFPEDTGERHADQADVVFDFTDDDTIWLKGSYRYVDNEAHNLISPGDGEYSIWRAESGWVVTFNSENDEGFHDIAVLGGGDPHDDVAFF
jgi:Ca2+-binding RTX toxin-like protein